MDFLPKDTVGLDISDKSIEVLGLKRRFGRVSVSGYSRRELKPGIVEDGIVKDQAALVMAIKETILRAGLKSKQAVLSIPDSKTFIYVFRLPAVISEKNIGEAVQYEAEATIPIAFHHAYHDFRVLAKTGDLQEVLYMACLKDIVDNLRLVVRLAGLEPVVVEPEVLSVARALFKHFPDEPVMVADIGSRTTVMSVIDRLGVTYSNVLKVAGQDLTQSIMAQTKVTESEAEKIKIISGLKKTSELKNIYNLDLVLGQIASALVDNISYYEQRYQTTIKQLLLCGGNSLMPGLAEYLTAALKISVQLGDPFANLSVDRQAMPNIPVLYTTVIGLAHRGVDSQELQKNINLLAQEHEHFRFQALKEFWHQPRQKARATNLFKMPRLKVEKRVLILIGVFVFLAIVFITILITQQNTADPLINLQDSSYPAQPVDY